MSNAALLRELLQEKIIVFDGAMGTMIQSKHLTAEDFGGAALEGCNEYLVMTRPDVIRSIHSAFLEAGADAIETDTFGGTPLVLAEYGLADRAVEINRTAAQLARRTADSYSTTRKPRFVAGSMGPTTKTISVTGGVTFQQLVDSFAIQARGLIDGGVDVLLLETAQDTLNLKAATLGIARAQRELGTNLPVMISGTIEPMGTMLAGQGVDALYASMEHIEPFSIGINCATGPKFMTDHIRSLAGMAQCFVSCIPNAGLPDEEGRYNETPDQIASTLDRFAREGWVNIVGGCCGTTPAYIAAIAAMAEQHQPRRPQTQRRFHVSGIEYLEFTPDNRPVPIGERTNVIGSRKFKNLIAAGQYEEASEIGRKQVRGGAQIVDVCLADPDRDEMKDIVQFLKHLTKKIKVTLMIDSTDPSVIEKALEFCQGKSIINSINLEDGEERFERVVPLAKRYGAALIVGCIDDDPKQGMAVTKERKLEIAARSYDLLTKKYGVKPQDIIFDALVFPCASGDENYIGSAKATIEGIRAIKEAFPDTLTVLGISNVSFGLPPAGREVLNSVFLYHCTKAGLDMAIVNTERLERYASIPEEERHLAEDLIYNRGEDPVAAFANFYRGKKTEKKEVERPAAVEDRLALYIVEGSKDGLLEDLDIALKKYKPLEIINGPLMRGMDKVGQLFNNNELIVAEVLQSAEAMKTAVAYLEPLMEKTETSTKGKMILATVKGDVHDIGKNLVEIILSNNGFNVVNLGIKVPPERLIEAYHEHKPDMIGLSGLLVKSAQQMVLTAEDLRNADISIPMLVGGAALSNKFTRTKIAPQYTGPVIYAKDAMQGLDYANQLAVLDRREALIRSLGGAEETTTAAVAVSDTGATDSAVRPHRTLRELETCPTPPDLKRHQLDDYPLDEIYPYLNLQMLLGKHLGLKGSVPKLLESGDEKALALQKQVQEVQDEVLSRKVLLAKAVFQFYAAYSDGDTLTILDQTRQNILAEIRFPRQTHGEYLCAADFVASKASGTLDYIALFITTCSHPAFRDYFTELKDRGQYVKSHIVQALAIECAEAFAELLHQKIRAMWGIGDPPEFQLLPVGAQCTVPNPGKALQQLIQAKYQGIRLSFGYPACPRLEDQEILFRLLNPESIGVTLTEGHMMEPEASVSAMVFHHPEARYFVAGE